MGRSGSGWHVADYVEIGAGAGARENCVAEGDSGGAVQGVLRTVLSLDSCAHCLSAISDGRGFVDLGFGVPRRGTDYGSRHQQQRGGYEKYNRSHGSVQISGLHWPWLGAGAQV